MKLIFEMKKIFFELMNNNIPGKTIKKKINARLGNNAIKYKAYKNGMKKKQKDSFKKFHFKTHRMKNDSLNV